MKGNRNMKRCFVVCFLFSLITFLAATGVPYAASPDTDRVTASQAGQKKNGAPEQDELAIASAAICWDIVNREVVDAGESFPPSVERLYCFTKVTGATTPTHISHVWYYGQSERARVRLPVNSASWRTYSSKRIQPREIGQWFVKIVGPGGKILKTLSFAIIP